MENTNEIKTRSIRADNESFEKFKLISEEFPNQAQALEALISVYEIEKSKAIMPERQAEIETFTVHMQKLNEIYNHSLLMNKDAETRIRAEFERQLSSKDSTIQELQERGREAGEAQKKANEKLADMQILTERSRGMEIEFEKNNNIIKSLTEITDEYKGKAKENDGLKSAISALEKQVAELQHENEKIVATSEQYRKELAETAEKHKTELEAIKNSYDKDIKRLEEQKDLEKDKAIVVLEREHTQKLNELHVGNQKRVEELLKQMEETKKVKEPTKSKAKKLTEIES